MQLQADCASRRSSLYPHTARQQAVRWAREGLTHKRISELLGGKPCSETVARWLRLSAALAGAVPVLAGHRGRVCSRRRWNPLRLSVLERVVQANESGLQKEYARIMERLLHVSHLCTNQGQR